jgi:hypothetical protein
MYVLGVLGSACLAVAMAAGGWALATDCRGMRKAGNAVNARMLDRVPPWSHVAPGRVEHLQDRPARLFGWALFGNGVLVLALIVLGAVRRGLA